MPLFKVYRETEVTNYHVPAGTTLAIPIKEKRKRQIFVMSLTGHEMKCDEKGVFDLSARALYDALEHGLKVVAA